MICNCSFSKEFAPNYFITKDGRVISMMSGKAHGFKHSLDKRGYHKIRHPKPLSIHRLVAEAFIPNPNNKRTVNHKDGNKDNNDITNLEWLTYSENNQHAYDTGLKFAIQGEDHSLAKLTEKQVKEIFWLCDNTDMYLKDIGNLYNISNTQVCDIKKEKSWKHLNRKETLQPISMKEVN